MVGVATPSSSTYAGYLRKIRKPLIEKKRRDRMNGSIEKLKILIADSLVDATSSKLDKADILDLTVSHIQRLKNQQASASMSTEASSYSSGFKDCVKETIYYLSATRVTTPESLGHLSNHLRTVYDKKKLSVEQVATTSRATSPAALTAPPQYCSTPVQGLHGVLNSSAFSSRDSFSDSHVNTQLGGHIYSGVMDISQTSRCRRVSSVSSGSSDNCSFTDISANSATGFSSTSDIVLEGIMNEEKPWRPW